MTPEGLFEKLNVFSPIELSYAYLDKGHYDNSGLIINSGKEIGKVLYSLDLSKQAVMKAKKLNCQAIVTHHPAIYHPIKNLDINGETAAVMFAVANGLSVISLHLNLDIADEGIDESLAKGLGAKETKIISYIYGNNGYGREFDIEPIELSGYAERVKTVFSTKKILLYGDKHSIIKKIASFCGGGSGDAAQYSGDADLIVTSDMPHHVIKNLVEKGKNILILPHYAAEEYGFRKFYERTKDAVGCECYYFEDKRFK